MGLPHLDGVGDLPEFSAFLGLEPRKVQDVERGAVVMGFDSLYAINIAVDYFLFFGQILSCNPSLFPWPFYQLLTTGL